MSTFFKGNEKQLIIYLLNNLMYNYLHYLMWRLTLSCAAVVLYFVICILKHSCGMITDTNLASSANVKCMLTVSSQYDATLFSTSFLKL